jgi:predicted amidophosphoribosyltransferase
MSQTSSFCDICGASNPVTSQFCHACGQALLHHLTPTGSLPTAHVLQQRYRMIKKLGQGASAQSIWSQMLNFLVPFVR